MLKAQTMTLPGTFPNHTKLSFIFSHRPLEPSILLQVLFNSDSGCHLRISSVACLWNPDVWTAFAATFESGNAAARQTLDVASGTGQKFLLGRGLLESRAGKCQL